MFILVNPKLGKIWSNTLIINKMEKNILKNGTRVISFAPDSESTNILGTVTDNYEFNGATYYDIHTDDQNEGEEDLDIQERGEDFELVPTKFINLTPHDIKLNDGTIYPTSGKVTRVANTFSNFCCGISKVFYGEIENLPEPEDGVYYIVSAMVLAANNDKPRYRRRGDLVAPATGHPDCVRENGFIVSVPGFIRY